MISFAGSRAGMYRAFGSSIPLSEGRVPHINSEVRGVRFRGTVVYVRPRLPCIWSMICPSPEYCGICPSPEYGGRFRSTVVYVRLRLPYTVLGYCGICPSPVTVYMDYDVTGSRVLVVYVRFPGYRVYVMICPVSRRGICPRVPCLRYDVLWRQRRGWRPCSCALCMTLICIT